MKIPKWQTDATWAIRRVVRKKERLPEHVEKLFCNIPAYCINYAKELNIELPDFLIQSMCDYYEKQFSDSNQSPRKIDLVKKEAANHIINYVSFGKQINDRLLDIYIKAVEQTIDSDYHWSRHRTLKFCEILKENIPFKLEQMMWNSKMAMAYSIQNKKRMPIDIEEKTLLEADDEDLIIYFRLFFSDGIPENIEKILLQKPITACMYAKSVSFAKLPYYIHNSLVMKTFEDCPDIILDEIKDYLHFLNTVNKCVKNALTEFDKNDTVGYVLENMEKLNAT